MTDQEKTVTQLINLLKGHAHMGFSAAVAEFPVEHINSKAPNVEYSFYALVEHINLTQQDIINYINAPTYHEPKWPEDYWPASSALPETATTLQAGTHSVAGGPAKAYQASQDDWEKSIRDIETGIEKLIEILSDPALELNVVVKHGSGDHTLLREILMVADHNAYHIGELAILRQVTDTWNGAEH